MEWTEVKDPNGEFLLPSEWAHVSSSFTPEEVQDLINKHGVRDMIRIVNDHFWKTYRIKPLVLAWVNNQKTIEIRNMGGERPGV